MFLLFYSILSLSIKVKINEIQYEGSDFDTILESYGLETNTIKSIIVQEGNFQVNSLSNQYKDLTTLEVPADSFSGSINDELFTNMDLLTTVIINGATSIGQSTFEGCKQLKTVQFQACTLVGSNSFQSCILLQNVQLPNVQIIESYAFMKTSITSIEFNSLTEIGDYGFSDCNYLSSINVPLLTNIGSYCFKGTIINSINFKNLIQMGSNGHCFDSCIKLETVEFEKNVILPQFSFYNCQSLHSVSGEKVTTIGQNCFTDCINLQTAIFESLLMIENNAFYGCIKLKEVDYPDVTDIGSSAFYSCTELTTVVMNSYVYVGSYAFDGCTSLSRIEIPKLKSLSFCAFRYTAIEKIEFPLLDTLNVGKVNNTNDVGGQFMYCTKLYSFTAPLAPSIPIWFFYGCESLYELSMDSVQKIGQDCFKECKSLVTINLPNVKAISDNLFSGSGNIVHVTFDSVLSIGNKAFQSCKSLETVSFKSCTSIGEYAFDGCQKLGSIDFPRVKEMFSRAFSYTNIEKVEMNSLSVVKTDLYNNKYHGAQFEGCGALTHVTMKMLPYVQIEMFFNCHQLIYVDMPSLQNIYYRGFYLCDSMNNLTFPSLKTIDEQAFRNLNGLTEIDLPSVTNIEKNAFAFCQNIVSFSAESCSSIGDYAFNNCTKLEKIILPKLRNIGARVFSYTNLSSVELNSLVYAETDLYSNDYHGAQFYSCRALTHITMKMMPYIQIEMFAYCDKLTFIDIPNVNEICEKAFQSCSSLSNITLPNINIIQSYAFQHVEGLIEVNLPSLTQIQKHSFENCPNLITFSSENCTNIEEYAFNNCFKLENIYLPKLSKLGARSFSYCNFSSIELNSLVSTSTIQYSSSYHGAQFQNCCSLKNVTMKSLGTVEIEMFYNCHQLELLELPNVHTINSNAFVECHALCYLNLPNLKIIDSSAFKSISGIFEVDLPSLTSINSYAFESCQNLVSFSAPNCTSIGEYAFQNCKKLNKVLLENVTTIYAFAFNKCESLESINLPKLNDLYARAFSFTKLKQVEFNSLTIARTENYAVGSQSWASHGAHFQECKALTHVTMKSMPYIQIEMFLDCTQLIYIDMPIIDTINYRGLYGCNLLSNLTLPKLSVIGEDAFRGNPSLIEINLPSVTNINQYAFRACLNLFSFSAENCVKVSEYVFYDCNKLKHIHFPKLTEIGPASFMKTNLTSVKLDSLVDAGTYRANGNVFHGQQFQNCSSLTYVSMKSMVYLQIEMFYYCTNLVEIYLPSCIQFNSKCLAVCESIKKVTFGHQSIQFGSIPSPNLLTHVSFPNAKTLPEKAFQDFKEMISCKLPLVSTIESSTFQGCLNLVDLELPSLNEIKGDYNFYNCENLPSLSLQKLCTVDPKSENIFKGCRGLKYISLPDRPPMTFNIHTFEGLECKIYIPSESIKIYDDNTDIEGDSKGDHKWCGIELSEFDMTKIIGDELIGIGASLIEACIAAGLTASSITNLKIVTGHLSQEEMNSFRNNFVNLNELIIEGQVSIEEDIIPQSFLLNHKEIKIVRIFSSIKIIDESAFQGCSKMETISCPNARELRSKCFFGPTSLEILSFELIETLTGSHFFSNNSMLKNIELPKLKSASITGYISENSPLIESISLPETPPKMEQGKFLLDVSPFLVGISNKAAIEYDAADSKDNDMRFYSLRLKYSFFLATVDGVRVDGISLKNMIPEGANVVEMIEGEITKSDFPLPDSITSFTVREEVSVNNIPSNAFAENENLKTVSIFSKTQFEIKEEAFSGCTSLTYVKINNATSLHELAFKGCSSLKTVILNDVQTIIGNSHFEGCNDLKSVSLQSLKTVPSSSNRIFLGCSKFSLLRLPAKPPKLFNKDTFSGFKDQLTLILPSENDYETYDKDVSIPGDLKDDGIWCGISLPSTIVNVKINQRGSIYSGNKLSDCIIASGISESQIKTLEILRGLVPVASIIETVRNLPFLETLKISSSVKRRGDFTDAFFSGLNLVSVSLPSVTTIPKEFFKDCIKLKSVQMEDATKICDSAFKGCKSLETISLNVEIFEGDSQFEGCTSLSSISITNLLLVNSSSANIFSDCPLTSINLPENPPKTFHKDTFVGKNVIIHGLSNEVLQIYDANTEVEGDVKDDLKWCGIDLVQLYLTVSINELDSVQSSSLAKAAEMSSVSEIKSIEIKQGMIKSIHMNELKTFPYLSRLTIDKDSILESTIINSGQFQDMTGLLHVKIMHNVTLMSNCFRGCTSLLSVEFTEVSLISEGSFRNCSSLNTLIIPGCKELRGDFVFSGCTSLRDVDLSSLLHVDSSGSKIFEGCNQLTIIKLPSIEPQTFHKDTFVDCPQVKLRLPKKADYLAYDDESHVVDDIKEDEKWCGIKIDSEFLPQLLLYRINKIEYSSRKLTAFLQNNQNKLFLKESSSDFKELELIGGLVDHDELKNVISNSNSIEKFIANIGTISDILSGTFEGCNSLKEIVIHSDVNIEYGALQKIPSLEKIALSLQVTIRSDEFIGDNNLQEISMPLLQVVPKDTFCNLTKLKSVDLITVYSISSNAFMNCKSLEILDLHSLEKIYGDSTFEGCINLRKIDLSNLVSVPQSSSRIFMNCIKLTNLSLGDQPPNRINEDVFKNAGILPNLSLPSVNSWKNYVPQSALEEDGRYIWYGIDTGITKDDYAISCPEQSEFSCSCPDATECSCQCPEISEISCPEQSESSYSCPETIECSCSCPEQSQVSCPEVVDCSYSCSCPEQSECSCPDNYISNTYKETNILSITKETEFFSDISEVKPNDKDLSQSNKKKMPKGAIAGIIIASVAIVAIISILVWYFASNIKRNNILKNISDNEDDSVGLY